MKKHREPCGGHEPNLGTIVFPGKLKLKFPLRKLKDPLYDTSLVEASKPRNYFRPYGQPWPYPEHMLRRLVKWYKGRTGTFRERCNQRLWNEAVKLVERLERAERRKP